MSKCEPFRQIIERKLEQGLSAQRMWQDLLDEHGFAGRYDSVKRFVRRPGGGAQMPFRRSAGRISCYSIHRGFSDRAILERV